MKEYEKSIVNNRQEVDLDCAKQQLPDSSHESQRRVTKACDGCRRLKEKCNGENPCARCLRFDRECRFSDAYKQKRIRAPKRRMSPSTILQQRESPRASFSSKSLCDTERLEALEQMAKRFTGIENPSRAQLHQALERLSDGDHQNSFAIPAVARGGDHPVFELQRRGSEDESKSGDHFDRLSHEEFSRLVQQCTSARLHGSSPNTTDNIANLDLNEKVPATVQLGSQELVAQNIVKDFPTADVALFLVDIFFEFAQTNYSYIDEETLRDKIDLFYSPDIHVHSKDVAWVCIVLAVFAIGTQFAHLNKDACRATAHQDSEEKGTSSSKDDTLALSFYRKACTLLSDVMTAASVESVQAFVLLGVYTLPVDPDGLSCTYLGIAIKLAVQNGLNLKQQDCQDARGGEIRRRIWWAACTLERRICIMHGRHVSISRQDIETDLPTDIPELRPKFRINTFSNVVAMIKLTDYLEQARDAIIDVKKSSEDSQTLAVQNLLHIKRQIQTYWDSLPNKTHCRDLTPGNPLFRFNIHLALTYHLIQIFIGRSFILRQTDTSSISRPTHQDELTNNCIESAISVIDTCQLLDNEIGLAKSSYTEFTSCCAALIAVLAKRISSETPRLKQTCTIGIALLKKMSVGIFARNSERLAVESLQMAVYKLDSRRREVSAETSALGYMRFRNWVSLQQRDIGESSSQSRQHDDVLLNDMGNDPLGNDVVGAGPPSFDMNSGCPSLSLGEFVSVPGLDEWFEYGLR